MNTTLSPQDKALITKGWKDYRASLGKNIDKMYKHLGLKDRQFYYLYERAKAIPFMYTYRHMRSCALENGSILPKSIYWHLLKWVEIPCIRNPLETEPLSVKTIVELRNALGLTMDDVRYHFSHIIANNTWTSIEKRKYHCNLVMGLLLEELARKNNLVIVEETFWNKKEKQNKEKQNKEKQNKEKQEVKPGLSNRSQLILKYWNNPLPPLPKIEEAKGSSIDELRCELGLTVEQFAAIIGVSMSTASQLCKNRFPTPYLAKRIQEEARLRGVAILLDEIYRDVPMKAID